MTVWLTSDWHLGHENIIGYCDRPFENVAHMHDELVSRFNACVEPEDTVYMLGDVAMGIVERSLRLVHAFEGHKILICGNHDKCWSGATGHGTPNQRAVEMYLEAGFDEVWNTSPEEPALRLQLGQHWVKMSHFPYQDVDRHSGRFSGWLPSPDSKLPWAQPEHRTEWLIHGHTHGKWRQKGQMIDVGVDSFNYYPVSEEELIKLIDAGPGDLPVLPKR